MSVGRLGVAATQFQLLSALPLAASVSQLDCRTGNSIRACNEVWLGVTAHQYAATSTKRSGPGLFLDFCKMVH